MAAAYMDAFDNKSVLVTGAARGQGRAHALAFAREGADVAICDICRDLESIPYPLGTASELEETAALVEAEGRRAVVGEVDVRDWHQVRDFVARSLAQLGKLDILVANAGIFGSSGTLHELSETQFDETIATNVKGVWHSMKAVVPHMAERRYGRIVVTGSTMSFNASPNHGHYAASKHAVLGLVKSLALEQGENGITVNAVCPTSVGTRMIFNDPLYAVISPEEPTRAGMAEALTPLHAIPEPWIEPEDVTKVVLFLASDNAAKMTGSAVTVDMAWTAR